MRRGLTALEKLDRLEGELLDALVPRLRTVASGQDTGFFTTELNNPWRQVAPSKAGTALLRQAHEIVALAEALGVSTSTLSASFVVAAFGRANDLTNPHRLGPIRLAQELLVALGAA